MATKIIKRFGWHFLPVSRELGYGDGRKAAVGKTLSIEATHDAAICSSGMHASPYPNLAAGFKKGPVITFVQVWGDIESESDKFCGRHRKVLWLHEVTTTDMKNLAKACKYKILRRDNTLSERPENLVRLGNHDGAAFNKFFETLRKATVSGAGVTVVEQPNPSLDEKALLAQLTPRVIRTKKEILKALGNRYDLTPIASYNSGSDDRFDEIVRASVNAIAGTIIIVSLNHLLDGYTLPESVSRRKR